MSAFILVLSVFVLGAGCVLGAYFAFTKLPGYLKQRQLNTRLSELNAPAEVEAADGDALVKDRHIGPLPAFDRMVGGSERGFRLGAWIEQSGLHVSVSALLLTSVALAAILGFGFTLAIKMSVGWVAGGLSGFALPWLYVKSKRTKRMAKFEEAFPDGLDLISRALKAGHAFATGLKMVADEMPEPVGPEFRKTFDEQNFGLPLKDALSNLTVRMPLLDVRFFSTAVLIQRETGGNLSEILENLAHVVRERFKILRQVRVYTAHGRMTGYVLLALPPFLSVALMFINPEHMQLLFREPIGHMMLGAAVIMQIIGYFWIKYVVKIEV
jgi:tight adherence protein B